MGSDLVGLGDGDGGGVVVQEGLLPVARGQLHGGLLLLWRRLALQLVLMVVQVLLLRDQLLLLLDVNDECGFKSF